MESINLVMMILVAIVGSVVGAVIVFIIKKKQEEDAKKSARVEADRIVNRAKSEVSRMEKEAKNRAKDFESRARRNAEVEIQKQKQKLKNLEQSLEDKKQAIKNKMESCDEEIAQKIQDVEEREKLVKGAKARLKELQAQSEEKLVNLQEKLVVAAGMSADEAKRELVAAMEDQAKKEASKLALKIETETQAEAEKTAKKVLSVALSRYAGDYVAEKTVSVVALPSDEIKGKIIGREGRNIRTLESLCGVDLIVDDTPEAVVIAGFDPVRRAVAKEALGRLIEDGRVHPARIEEVVESAKGDIFNGIREAGERAMMDLGLQDVHPEIINLIGALKYRTSYTQNQYTHVLEVGFFCGIMAAELGLNVKKARRAGVFHDIGKALDHSIEGSHAVIGADFIKKYGEAPDIVHAVRAHHEDVPPETALDFLVIAGDKLSGARPGARRSMMQSYIQRLEDLESIANSFDGVIRSFALQAGREIRVMVEGSRVTDEHALMMSRDIARKIESELVYPGQIKVTVVRETRAVEHAR